MKVSMMAALVLLVSLNSGCQFDGENGKDGVNGETGATGPTGAVGEPGKNAPVGMALTPIARYVTGSYGAGAAEIAQYDATRQQVLVVNGAANQVEVIKLANLTLDPLSDPFTANNLTSQPLVIPSKVQVLNSASQAKELTLGMANSISVYGDLLAIAVEAVNKTDAGAVLFYQLTATTPMFLHAVEVGALPDMVTFTPDGKLLLVANEGEPADDYHADPEGSISLIAISNQQPGTMADTLNFHAFNESAAQLVAQGGKLAAPAGTSVSQDLEPEYITVSADSQKAYVSLQENNALAEVDLVKKQISRIYGLGTKDHSLAINSLDVSNKDGVHLQTVPGLRGLYQPDTIASFQWQGATFIVTANEGDARDWSGYSEQARVSSVTRSSELMAKQAGVYSKDGLGRLNITTALGQSADGFTSLYSYGARSFSIWDSQGQQVFDSGNDMERITAALHGAQFNSNHLMVEGDNRSDDKGPEPEALTLGVIDGRRYAFIGAERMSSIFVYDVTNPFQVRFVDYGINRNLNAVYSIDDDTVPATVTGDVAQAGDLGPESLVFVDAAKSPVAQPLLISANEVSGTVTVYRLQAKY